MEYVQCNHCSKRYDASDKMKTSEGEFITCEACQEQFLVIVQDDAVIEVEETTSAAGWDPSLTMPEQDDDTDARGKSSFEQSLTDKEAEGARVLAALQAKRKKKQLIYIFVALFVAALGVGVYFLTTEEVVENKSVEPVVKTAAQLEEGAKVRDANSPECRLEAATQWMIDYKAMHGDYSGTEFLRLLKMNKTQTEKVQEHCRSKTVIQDIIKAATAQQKPSWFAAEIEILASNRSR